VHTDSLCFSFRDFLHSLPVGCLFVVCSAPPLYIETAPSCLENASRSLVFLCPRGGEGAHAARPTQTKRVSGTTSYTPRPTPWFDTRRREVCEHGYTRSAYGAHTPQQVLLQCQGGRGGGRGSAPRAYGGVMRTSSSDRKLPMRDCASGPCTTWRCHLWASNAISPSDGAPWDFRRSG
jgi:hypothetical protein